MKNTAIVVAANAATYVATRRGRSASGYPDQSGRSRSDANLVHPETATAAPRTTSLVSA